LRETFSYGHYSHFACRRPDPDAPGPQDHSRAGRKGRAGALGYLLKDTPAEKLIETIRRVHAGEVFIQPEIASRALREMMRPEAQNREPLSEREVLVLLAQGGSNKDIAEKLVITEGTVKNHVPSILAKLQAENRTQAADIARKRGLV
jgi:DNA-binding NarL/FixJ family response regulator